MIETKTVIVKSSSKETRYRSELKGFKLLARCALSDSHRESKSV